MNADLLVSERSLAKSMVKAICHHPRLASVARSTLNLVAPRRPVEVTVRQGPLRGAKLSLNLRKEKAFWLGLYEPWVQSLMCGVLGLGDRAWDVGACFGYHTLLMCRLSGPENVVAIEPDPDNRIRLFENLRANNFGVARIAPVAVGETAGQSFLRRNPADPGRSFIDPFGDISVDFATLDFAMDTYGPPRLVKVDVEGAEESALLGATRLLEEVRPMWIIELHDEESRVVEILQDSGYHVRGFGKGYEFDEDLPIGGPRHIVAAP